MAMTPATTAAHSMAITIRSPVSVMNGMLPNSTTSIVAIGSSAAPSESDGFGGVAVMPQPMRRPTTA